MKKQQTKHELPKRHFGIFRKQLSLWQAVALIVSGTVGAGVLGIPYAIAQVGVIPGTFYIIGLGLAMMGLNLLLGSVSSRTKKPLQLVGLAEAYLGKPGKVFMTLLFYVSMLAVLLIYIIGVGETLTALLGKDPFFWSTVFFAIATLLVIVGIRTIKTVELVLTIGILAIICIVAIWAVPHVDLITWRHVDLSNAFLPYGVILFAFHAAFAIPEAHQLLRNSDVQFKKAIGISSATTIALYTIFAIAVVSVTGTNTTEIATIGLGEAIGPMMVLFGNVFAILAMSTSYLLVGLSMKHSLHWDFKIPGWLAALLVSAIPFCTFLLGVNQFIQAIGIVGGVFVSLEMILIILVYLVAKKRGELKKGTFLVRHSLLLVVLLLVLCSAGVVVSIL